RPRRGRRPRRSPPPPDAGRPGRVRLPPPGAAAGADGVGGGGGVVEGNWSVGRTAGAVGLFGLVGGEPLQLEGWSSQSRACVDLRSNMPQGQGLVPHESEIPAFYRCARPTRESRSGAPRFVERSEEHTSEVQSRENLV